MKKLAYISWIGILGSAWLGHAATERYDFKPLLSIPDNDPFGITDTQTINSGITAIDSMTVSLTITGSPIYTGDYTVTLTHETGVAVLLNRSGRGIGDPITAEFGYNDPGFNRITFSDTAVGGDVHVYRLKNGEHSVPWGGPVSGIWEPDGRYVDPLSSTYNTPRTAFLGSFSGLNASGLWTLSLADAVDGGQGTLTGWSMELSGVPEPSSMVLVVSVGLVAVAIVRRVRGSARRAKD